MQVFDLTEMKNMFHLKWKPIVVFYLVFDLVSRFIHLIQMVIIYWLLTSWIIIFIIHPTLKLIKSWVLFSWWLNNLICQI